MSKRFFVLTLFLFIISLELTALSFASAQGIPSTSKNICATYFTGVGCPHCAKTDPFVFGDLLSQNPNLVIIEYEIYQNKGNAPLLLQFNQKYNFLPESRVGIPLLIFNKDNFIVGDEPIIKDAQKTIDTLESNPCLLINGSSRQFDNLDLTQLPGKPKIWSQNRILIKEEDSGEDNKILRELIETKDLRSLLKTITFEKIQPIKVALSGKYLKFDNAIKVDNGNWIFQWNGSPSINEFQDKTISTSTPLNTSTVSESQSSTDNKPTITNTTNPESKEQPLTIAKIASLAAVDAINPCALAVLILMLVSILAYNPGKKKEVLMAGLSFISAVIVGYFIYGLAIIKFWQVAQFLAPIKLRLYKILGILAIILGVLEIKDFIAYHPGGVFTEMPLSLRPKVKRLISKITSAKGAFFVGLFVTVFLLPCTIGPYVIAGGILSKFTILKVIPWLIVYNLIFVLPMVGVVVAVYLGLKRVEDISKWREKNIRYLHLISGIIMAGLGIIMALGLF